jgi:hypothetical protein
MSRREVEISRCHRMTGYCHRMNVRVNGDSSLVGYAICPDPYTPHWTLCAYGTTFKMDGESTADEVEIALRKLFNVND